MTRAIAKPLSDMRLLSSAYLRQLLKDRRKSHKAAKQMAYGILRERRMR